MAQNRFSNPMNMAISTGVWSTLILVGVNLALAGCGKTPMRPQSALRSPSGYNDGQASLLNAPGPHPLLVVTLPNTPNGKPHVDTVLSVLAPHAAAASAAPPPPPPPTTTTMQVHEEAVPATRPGR
ncbi:MAG: hypothetical protein ACP5QA_01585 [Phycisphaerae bacterium]